MSMDIRECSQRRIGRPPSILAWLPQRWEHFVGNKRAISVFKKLVKKLRAAKFADRGAIFAGASFLFSGLSRTGKTALVKHLVRCIVCDCFDEATLNPCDGTCRMCSHRPELAGLTGLFSQLTYGQSESQMIPVHLSMIDCTMIQTPNELRDHLWTLGAEHDGIRIFYFDEVHRLIKRQMDEMLLKTIEEKQALWFFSTAEPEGLEQMFKNRLLKLSTELPEPDELAVWLATRCYDWDIRWDKEAIIRVVDKSNCVPGTALHALALASLDDDNGLTVDLVENDWSVEA